MVGFWGKKNKQNQDQTIMELQTLTRQTGVYGTVNEGDTITVSDSLGQELIDNGNFKKADKKADDATPDEVSGRNASGLATGPLHTDGTDRENSKHHGP